MSRGWRKRTLCISHSCISLANKCLKTIEIVRIDAYYTYLGIILVKMSFIRPDFTPNCLLYFESFFVDSFTL